MTTQASGLSVERVRLDDGDLASAWTALERRNGVSTPFLSYQWYRPMTEIAPLIESAEALLCRRNDHPVGLLPIETVEHDGLRTLGVAGWHWFTPDHLDVVAAPEDRAAVAQCFAGHLASRRDWDVLDLDALAEHSPLLPALRSTMRRPRFVTRPEEPVSIRIRTVDPASGISVGKWARKRLRRTAREVEELGGTIEFVTDPARVPALLDALMDLHRARFQNRSTVFATPDRRRFHRAAAAAMAGTGQARIARLTVGDVDAALMYILTWRSTAYLYSSGLNPDLLQSAGSVLRDWVLTQAASEGFGAIDFLRGEQEWKDQFADAVVHDSRVRVVRTTPRVVVAGVERALNRARRTTVDAL
jgi:CelD/BcsL family acetyltransferase involved in cellulose biosynthesis